MNSANLVLYSSVSPLICGYYYNANERKRVLSEPPASLYVFRKSSASQVTRKANIILYVCMCMAWCVHSLKRNCANNADELNNWSNSIIYQNDFGKQISVIEMQRRDVRKKRRRHCNTYTQSSTYGTYVNLYRHLPWVPHSFKQFSWTKQFIMTFVVVFIARVLLSSLDA